MRLVLDTNILVGALITTGTPPDRLYQAWLRGDIELVTSTAQIAEIADVLARPRLQKFLDADEAAIIVQNIGARALVLDEPPGVNLSPDSKDNPILAAAVAGKANLIVSGDKSEPYRVSQRPHCLGGWGLWDVQVGFHRRCASAPPDGRGAPGGPRLGMGGAAVGGAKTRLHGGDAAKVGAAGAA